MKESGNEKLDASQPMVRQCSIPAVTWLSDADRAQIYETTRQVYKRFKVVAQRHEEAIAVHAA